MAESQTETNTMNLKGGIIWPDRNGRDMGGSFLQTSSRMEAPFARAWGWLLSVRYLCGNLAREGNE
jgi:hypothetical protein